MKQILCGVLVVGLTAWGALAAEDYKLGPDSMEQPGVPQGQGDQVHLEEQGLPRHRARLLGLRPGAVRRQDAGLRHGLPGRRRLRRTTRAQFRVPIVFDNLIHKKEMPVTIGIFINPGDVPGRASQGQKAAQQPQLRVRHAVRPVRPLPREGDPARGRQEVQPARATPPAGRSAASARAASAPSPPPGSGPTCSARCSATSAASPTSAAATSTRA